MRRFDAAARDFEPGFRAFLDERRGSPAEVEAAAAEIIAAVRAEGLEAVLRYSRQFDRAELDADTIRVPSAEIEAGAATIGSIAARRPAGSATST